MEIERAVIKEAKNWTKYGDIEEENKGYNYALPKFFGGNSEYQGQVS
jgi:hypothetical protein